MLDTIPEIPVIEKEQIVDFLLYRIYLLYRPSSIPKHIRQNFSQPKPNTLNDIITFFEKFLSENNDVTTLKGIKDDLKRIFFGQKHGKTGNIETIGNYLLSLLENTIAFEKNQELVKNRIKSIVHVSPESTKIILEDNMLDFEKWSEIYERYLVSLNTIVYFPIAKKYRFIEKYRQSFLPEKRKETHIFVKTNFFFEYFGVENFYKSLIEVIKNASFEEKQTWKSILEEHLCTFEREDAPGDKIMVVQNELMTLLKK